MIYRILLSTMILVAAIITAFADNGTVCVENAGTISAFIITIVGIVVTIASALSNVISKDTLIGKIINFLAVNIKVEKKQTDNKKT